MGLGCNRCGREVGDTHMKKPLQKRPKATSLEFTGSADLWEWLISRRNCLTLSELDNIIHERGSAVEAEELRARFQKHVDEDSCKDCQESFDALLLISKAADAAIHKVIPRIRYGKAS